MKRGDRFIGGIADIVSLLEHKRYKNVIICLWFDKHTIPSIIGGSRYIKCNHTIVEDRVCKVCGAYVGSIGQEQDINALYEHVYWLVNQLHEYTDRVIIKSPWVIPTEYKHKLTGCTTPFESVTSHIIYDRVIPMSNKDKRYDNNWYLTVFSNKNTSSFISASSVYCANMCVYDLLLEDCIIVNPDIHELRYDLTKNYLICNDKIVDILKNT